MKHQVQIALCAGICLLSLAGCGAPEITDTAETSPDMTTAVTEAVTTTSSPAETALTAADESAPVQSETTAAPASANRCGDNAFWSFDAATGTLTISGTGRTYDYGDWGYGQESPGWCPAESYATQVKKAVIQEGITGLGDCLFFASGLQSVELPESLTSIGELVFHNCDDLTEITIPRGVTEIGEGAFGEYGNGGCGVKDGFVVHGYTGSAAQRHVEEVNARPENIGRMVFAAIDGNVSATNPPAQTAVTAAQTAQPASAPDFKALYKRQIQAMGDVPVSGGIAFYSIDYALFDMNHDGIPELIVKSGTCEADYQISFYTATNDGLQTLGTGFSGSHCAFYKDTDKDQFVTQWGHMGTGGIEWYTYNGNEVTIEKEVDGIDYMYADDIQALFNRHGNFTELKTLSTSYVISTSGEAKWAVYTESGSTERDTIDTSLIDNY